MCVLSRHTFFRERERETERDFSETLNVQQAKKKKKGKKRGEKKRGFFLGPSRQRREELFPFVNRFVLSFLTKEEEGRARARTHTHTERVCE